MSPPAHLSRPPRPTDLPDDAAILGRAGGENFTVASRLLPAAARAHLLAFYGYARLVDEIGDAYDGDRLAALDWVAAELDAAWSDPGAPGLHPLVAAAASSARAVGAGAGPLRALVEANRMDQTVTTYGTWDDLRAYCRLSAEPVGRLVLAAFDATTPDSIRLSDDVCTALQVAEHLQDLAEDARAGRVYLPVADMVRFGVDAVGLVHLSGPAGSGRRAPFALRALIAFEASRARALLDGGSALTGLVHGRARLAVTGFVAGGYAALDALQAAGWDPLAAAPKASGRTVAAHVARLLARNARTPA
jgi:squalene synthase HpnC